MLGLDPLHLALAAAITLFGGFVKGAVGFAQPMIMISGLASFLPPEVALAALIVPTVLANVWQSTRLGLHAALGVIREFRLYIAALVICIALAAQLVTLLPGPAMLLILGVPIALFCLAQLLGFALRIARGDRRAEAGFGVISGVMGGLTGVWGPLTVIYLTAMDIPKSRSMIIQGVIYGVGAVALLLAHLRSGVLNEATLPLSAALVVPSMLGMALGFAVHDRLDQRRFRQATLVVLLIAALNLIRRGLA